MKRAVGRDRIIEGLTYRCDYLTIVMEIRDRYGADVERQIAIVLMEELPFDADDMAYYSKRLEKVQRILKDLKKYGAKRWMILKNL